jgi:hypothetical protein
MNVAAHPRFLIDHACCPPASPNGGVHRAPNARIDFTSARAKNAAEPAMTIHMLKHFLGQHDEALHLNLSMQDVDELIARL